MDESLRADILRVIPATISEVFLLVSLIVDAILDQATIHQRRQTLNKMTNGLGLQDAYSTTLDRIKEQKESKRKLGMEALMWISRSERPLKAQELCHALTMEAGTTDLNADNVPSIKTLLGCTLGLVSIDPLSLKVRLIHFTLQEYLGTHANLFITPHAMMAEICLTYLNFQSICKLSPTLRTIPTTTPFLDYALCYWGSHARREETDGVKSLALQLLQRDGDHISAGILLRKESSGTISWNDFINGRHPDPRGFTGLHCIACMQVPGVEIAMVGMKRWDLNGCDYKGATPLVWAVKHGNYRLTKLLLEQQDVDPNLSDRRGLTPLAHAARGVYIEVVQLLLNRESVNPESSGNEATVKLLLDRDSVNPESFDNCGRSSLLYAARRGYEVVVKLLLDQESVNPDSVDKNGRTPQSYAARSGNEDVVKLLLDQESVNPDSVDMDGRTPLSRAAESGHEGVVKLLLERGAFNPNASPDNSQASPPVCHSNPDELFVDLVSQPENPNSDTTSDQSQITPILPAHAPEQKVVPNPKSP
ncbi:ankyrin [Choiromyces venosus 120613-1]|uniref:Ankyrin n=1 Tax=Choiromyces venosus 120613-1 TaxID=1336337 RepID=A0A3N4JHK6_9PEZI|nr:ankyrin [Choiromyces venosus 120613-1]